MEIKEFVYNGKVVEFLFQADVMVNATEMAAVFDEKVSAFLRLEPTKKWIQWLENNAIGANRSANSALRFARNGVLPGEIKHRSADLVPILVRQIGGGEGGTTWMHRLLAIDFAMWLDVDFKGWVITKIDELLLSYAFEKSARLMAQRALNDELKTIEESAAMNPQVKRIFELLQLQKQLKGEEFNSNKNFRKSLFD